MLVESNEIAKSLRKWPLGKWLIYTLESMAVLLTLVEFHGLLSKGMRFLGGYSTKPNLLFIFILSIGIIIWIICGYVLLKRVRGVTAWKTRKPEYNKLTRIVASITMITSIVILLYLIFGIFRYDVVNAGEVKDYQLGIAVAEFGMGVDKKESSEGKELSAFISRNLRKSINMISGLKGNVTITSAPLIRNVEEAEIFGQRSRVSLVIWGWLPETEEDLFLPTFTFIEHKDVGIQLDEIPPWYDIEIKGDGSLELSQMFATKTSSLIEYIMGLILLEQGQYDNALTKFQHAIQLTESDASYDKDSEFKSNSIDRTLAIYHLAVGRTHAVMEQQDLAKAEYELALKLDAEYGPIYIGLGNIDYTEHRCIEALSWYDRAVTNAPEKASSWYARGNANFCLGDYKTSVYDYQQALDVAKPNDKSLPLYHLVLGITLCKLERDEQGIKELSRSREISTPGSNISTSAENEIKNCQAVPTETIEPLVDSPETIEPTSTPTETTESQATSTETPSAETTPTPTLLLTMPNLTASPAQPFPSPTSTPPFKRPRNKPQPTLLPTSFPTQFPPTPTQFPTSFPTLFPTRLPNRPTSPPTTFPTAPGSQPSPVPTSVPSPIPTELPSPPPEEPTSVPSPIPTETPEG
jgi:tetratricopeptide (TPR) repeat protein